FAIDFPAGWEVNNGQTQVVAKEPGGKLLMVLQQVQRPQGRTIDDIALLSMEQAGFRPVNGAATTINGLTAFVGTYQGALQDLGTVNIRAGHLMQDRNVFLVAGIAPAPAYDAVEPAFSKSIRSFRPMTRGEAEGIRPNRIALYT